MKKQKGNFWFGLTLVLIAIIDFYQAIKFPSFEVSGIRLPGPAFFPVILGIVFLIAGVYEIICSFMSGNTFKINLGWFKSWENKNIIFFLFSSLIYVILLNYFGFIICTLILLVILMLRLRVKFLTSIGISLIVLAIILVVFQFFFNVSFPTGIFSFI